MCVSRLAPQNLIDAFDAVQCKQDETAAVRTASALLAAGFNIANDCADKDASSSSKLVGQRKERPATN